MAKKHKKVKRPTPTSKAIAKRDSPHGQLESLRRGERAARKTRKAVRLEFALPLVTGGGGAGGGHSVGLPVEPVVDPTAKATLDAKVRTNVPMPELAVPLVPIGVYFDNARHTAIVYACGKKNASVVRISQETGAIEQEQMRVDTFTREYVGRWPAYPVRRAARLYLNSQLPKSETALRVLKMLVTQ